MTDPVVPGPPASTPEPPGSSIPPPPPPTSGSPMPPPPYPAQVRGPVGKVRSPAGVIIFTIITLGIYGLVWQYKVFKELNDRTGSGVGGPVGLVIAILIGVVNWFLLPSEIGNMYARAGLTKPVSGPTGFWNLIPLVGFIVWVVKVQGALNRAWETGNP